MLLTGEYLSASEAKAPFAQRQVTLSFQDYIQLEAEKNYWHAQFGSPYKSMQVDFYQRVTEIGVTNKNRQVNAQYLRQKSVKSRMNTSNVSGL